MHSTKRNDVRIVRQAACAGALLLLCAAAGWGQTNYEASGQTAVFTLTPGAKIGPNAIRGNPVLRTAPLRGIDIAVVQGGIVITLSSLLRGHADIAIYNLTGRQVYRQHGMNGLTLRVDTRRFTPGIYHARVRIDGQDFSRRFAVSR
jgi:hypothetical protein